jgi:Regulator of ribonuclease activity B
MRKSCEEVVELQHRMNRLTFRRLLELGLSSSDELRLDFTFVADDEEAARQLLAYLNTETNYDVEVALGAGVWSLTGTTQATLVTLEILDQWVEWMAAVGIEHQCEFDGWGTSIG